MSLYSDIRIQTSTAMEERALHARSPSRAARRARRGYPQNYAWPMRRAVVIGDVMTVHPAMLAELERAIRQQ